MPGTTLSVVLLLERFDLPLSMGEFRETGIAFMPDGRSIPDLMRMSYDREPQNLEASVRLYCGREH